MTSLTLEDFLKYSKKQAEEQDEKRSADLVKLSAMVKSEIDSALDPVITRQEKYEQKTNVAIENINKEVASIKALVSSDGYLPPPALSLSAGTRSPAQKSLLSPRSSAWPPLPACPPTHALPPMPPRPPTHAPTSQQNSDILRQKFEEGRLTLGFEPISMKDLSRLSRQHDIHDQELLMKMAILEYIRLDMTIKSLETSNIIRVFTQGGRFDSEVNRFYATFDSQATVSLIWRHVSKLSRKQDHHVMIYVPNAFQNQLRYLDQIAYSLRNPPPGKERSRTRIMYGTYSLYLQQKPFNSNRWLSVHAEHLPPGDLEAGVTVSASPPPGRQRDGISSTSSNDLTGLPKRAASSSPEIRRQRKQSRKVSGSDSAEETVTVNLEQEVKEPAGDQNISDPRQPNATTTSSLNCQVPT